MSKLGIGPIPSTLVAMLKTLGDDFVRDFDPIKKIRTGKIQISTSLTLMNFLNNPFYLWVLRNGRIDEVVTCIFSEKLLVSKEESIICFTDELLHACIVDCIIKIRIYTPFVI